MLDSYEIYKSFNVTDTTLQFYFPGMDYNKSTVRTQPIILCRLQKIQEQPSIYPDLLRQHHLRPDHQGQ